MSQQRVLIVDDSSTVRQQLRSFLEQNGYGVTEAPNAAMALQEIQRNAYDLIITDFNMPSMNGSELVQKVRSLPQHERTPIFVLTTEAAGEPVRLGKEAGATAWIVKPWKPDALLNGIRLVLGGSTLRRRQTQT